MPATTRAITARREPLEAPCAAALAICWTISPTALLASPGAAILNGQAAKLRACALVVHVDHAVARAELAVELTTGERTVIPLAAPAPIERATDDIIESIEAPGLIALTLRTEGDAPAILYARTPLLEHALALPGGVYDAPTLA